MRKIYCLLFILCIVSCNNKIKSDTSQLGQNSDSISKVNIPNKRESKSKQNSNSDYSIFYTKILSYIKNLDYNKSEKLKNRYSFKQFKHNNKVDIVDGVRLRKVSNNNLWVDIIIYKYDSFETANKKAEKIKNDKFLDVIFKDWNNLYQSNEYLILIKTGCSNTKKSWDKITKTIDLIEELTLILKCECGGRCSK